MELSDRSKKILELKIEEWNLIHLKKVTEDQMLEYMIGEFEQSTPREKSNQHKRKLDALEIFLDTNKLSSIKDAWYNGWITGWYQFQMRKESSHLLKRGE
jgi:hypothetical protein